MNKKKLTLIIVGTLLAMALVASALVLWLIPGGNETAEPNQTNGSMIDDKNGPNAEENQESEEPTVNSNEPTVGVEVEDPATSGNSGNSGNTGNGGNSGNSGNSGNGGNNEIDFDDLLGAG